MCVCASVFLSVSVYVSAVVSFVFLFPSAVCAACIGYSRKYSCDYIYIYIYIYILFFFHVRFFIYISIYMYIRNHFGVSSLAQDHIIWVSVLLAAGVMGKSQNKQLATPIDSPSDLDNSAGAPTDWFLSIPPAEQEQELKRQEEREQEAHFREEKKTEDDKW